MLHKLWLHCGYILISKSVTNRSRLINMQSARQRAAATSFSVVVPEGCTAGDLLCVQSDHGAFNVTVPDGCFAGASFEVTLPVPPPPQPQHEVVIPDGCFAGDTMCVELGGQFFNVAVPHGMGPGDVLACNLDCSEQTEQQPAGSSEQTEQQPAGSSEQDEQMVTPESPPLPPTPGDAPPAHGLYSAGERVELLRSDGSYSLGTVVGCYDGPFESPLYQVRMDNGVFKHAVAEEECFRVSVSTGSEATDEQARTLVQWQICQMMGQDD